MPRPKRSKATPSLTIPRNRQSKSKESIDVPSSTSGSTFNDLYDVSDNEDERRLGYIDNGKGKGKKKEMLVSPLAQAFLEMEREQFTDLKKGRTISPKKISTNKSGPSSSSSSPTFEIGNKEEPTPIRESLALAISNLRTNNNSLDLELSETHDNSTNGPGESMISDQNRGSKTRRSRRSESQADIQVSPNSLPDAAQYNRNDENEFSFDVSTPIKVLDATRIDSSFSTSSSKSKKRKLQEIQVPRSSFETIPSVVSETNEIVPSTNPSISDGHKHTGERKENILISVEDRSPTPQNIRDIMAPPHSSSSILSSPVAPPRLAKSSNRNLRSLRTKTPTLRIDSDSEISSPPSLTHSPDLPSPSFMRSKEKKPELSHFSISTAQLKALLPRRRHRSTRYVFEGSNIDNEISISGLASDEDELSHVIMGPQTRNRNAKQLKGPPARALIQPKKSMRMRNVKTGTIKTYGSIDNSSPSDSMGENEDDHQEKPPTESGVKINQTPQELGKELKKAVQKFKEVDNWALEFEDATGSSVSPNDAR